MMWSRALAAFQPILPNRHNSFSRRTNSSLSGESWIDRESGKARTHLRQGILGGDSPFFPTIGLFKNQLFSLGFGGFLEKRIPGKNGEGTPRMICFSPEPNREVPLLKQFPPAVFWVPGQAVVLNTMPFFCLDRSLGFGICLWPYEISADGFGVVQQVANKKLERRVFDASPIWSCCYEGNLKATSPFCDKPKWL